MSRYFIEVAYKGTAYSGFQVQENATTIQAEIEKAFTTLHRKQVVLTGSSRTDSGVHALQNYFHFDFDEEVNPQVVYKMNAILPRDIVVKNVMPMADHAHSRFDAVSRAYQYHVHRFKDPFSQDVSFYYPYKLDFSLMNQAAGRLVGQHNFFAFAKTNTQVKNFFCIISRSEWSLRREKLDYNIEGNRFLRGMVRLITATLLQVGRHRLSMEDFEMLLENNQKAGLSVPARGLFLTQVKYPENYFPATGGHFSGF